jgi:hypothetical protein
MSSISGVGAPTASTPPQNPVSQSPAAPADKGANASPPASPPASDDAKSSTTVQPSKPPGQGQVVYISA